VMKGFNMIESFGYVLLMTIAQLPGYFTAAWLIERVGRKFVLSTYLLGTALSAVAFGHAETLATLLTFVALLSFFNFVACGALYAYSPDKYPTAIRATGSGAAAAVGRVGGIFGPLLVGFLLNAGYGFGTIFGLFCGAILIGILAVII